MAEPCLLIVSGPPGAGKSTVAQALVGSAGAAAIYIEGDTFWSFIAKGGVKPTSEQARRQNITVMQSMTAAARQFARQGYETILDFSIGPWFMPAIKPILHDVALEFVVLCPSVETCAKRVAERMEGRMPDYGPYEDMHAAFLSAPGFERHTITEELEPVAMAARIRAGLSEGAFRIA